jgi:hypothetical protein
MVRRRSVPVNGVLLPFDFFLFTYNDSSHVARRPGVRAADAGRHDDRPSQLPDLAYERKCDGIRAIAAVERRRVYRALLVATRQ